MKQFKLADMKFFLVCCAIQPMMYQEVVDLLNVSPTSLTYWINNVGGNC